MSCVKSLREHLDEHHIKYVIISHSRAFTAQEIAASMHIPGREMAKTVVVKTARGLALVVVRAQDHLDLARVSRALGAPAKLAGEDELAIAFPDCELGAMPPIGTLYKLPTLVDEEIAKDREIVFNAGTHTDAVRVWYEEYAKLVKPKVLPLAFRPGQILV